jgi:anti-sigma28 factor (negative regulator of flagellin synthesis)
MFFVVGQKAKAPRKELVKAIKEMIENGTYDWKAAVENAASRIVENPSSLLWR